MKTMQGKRPVKQGKQPARAWQWAALVVIVITAGGYLLLASVVAAWDDAGAMINPSMDSGWSEFGAWSED